MKSECLCVVVLVLLFGSGHSNSPCPDIFNFFTDGENEFGRITLVPVEVVSKLQIRINFTVQANLGDYIGRLDSPDDVLQKYNKGETVYYKVYFPVSSPRPKVTNIAVNGDTICSGPGDEPRPNQIISTASLGETAYYSVGGPPAYKKFYREPQTIAQSRPQDLPPPILYHSKSDDEKYINREPQTTPQPKPQTIVQSRPQQLPPPILYHSKSDDEKYIKAFIMQRFSNLYGEDTSPTVTQHTTTVRPTTTTTATPQTKIPRLVPRFPDTTTATIGCGEVADGNGVRTLIHNGLSFDRGEVPWLVAIFVSTKGILNFICGGTLVSDRHVITAGHCMQPTTAMKDLVLKLGAHELHDWGDDLTIIAKPIAVDRPGSNPYPKDDILVITLNKRVTFTRYIRPACLWSGYTELNRIVGSIGVVAGWGGINKPNADVLDEPQKVHVPIVSTKECRASLSAFHTLTSDKTMCAGSRNGDGPCVGDSGGGLYLIEDGKWRLRGVVSTSTQDLENPSIVCNLNEYVVYTDTAQYLPWIRNILSKDKFH